MTTITVGPTGRGVKVYRPAITVKLLKMVARRDTDAERFTAAEREIDLTPYLGDGGAVRVSKSLGEAAGGWTVSFGDRMEPKAQDSLAGLIEPMDMIEIRGAREPHLVAGQPLPLLMRGFVSTVRRSEAMGSDGTPKRAVVLQGQDSGKLWLIHQVLWEVALLADSQFLDLFRLQGVTGLEVAYLPVGDFVKQLTERIVNARTRELAAYSSRQVAEFRVDATVKQGLVSPTTTANLFGPMWQIAEAFADRPWNELFIEDEEEGPVVRFRPAPYKAIDGTLIMPDAVEPDTVEVYANSIVSLDMARSDGRVANYFYVPPGSTMLDVGGMVNVATIQRGEPFDNQHPNNKPELYGIRKMEVATRLLPDLSQAPAATPNAQNPATGDALTLWHHQRMRELRLMNRDNALFEEGRASIIGHEALKPGRYLRIIRGDVISEAYITRVDHSFAPLDGWTTNLVLERGTGFIERSQSARSPYLAEGRKGPYA